MDKTSSLFPTIIKQETSSVFYHIGENYKLVSKIDFFLLSREIMVNSIKKSNSIPIHISLVGIPLEIEEKLTEKLQKLNKFEVAMSKLKSNSFLFEINIPITLLGKFRHRSNPLLIEGGQDKDLQRALENSTLIGRNKQRIPLSRDEDIWDQNSNAEELKKIKEAIGPGWGAGYDADNDLYYDYVDPETDKLYVYPMGEFDLSLVPDDKSGFIYLIRADYSILNEYSNSYKGPYQWNKIIPRNKNISPYQEYIKIISILPYKENIINGLVNVFTRSYKDQLDAIFRYPLKLISLYNNLNGKKFEFTPPNHGEIDDLKEYGTPMISIEDFWMRYCLTKPNVVLHISAFCQNADGYIISIPLVYLI